MIKKILILGILGVFLLTSITVAGINITKLDDIKIFAKPDKSTILDNGDQMDQINMRSDDYSWGCSSDRLLAQSFKPTLEILTRVKVRLHVQGSPDGLEISIRKNLESDDLTKLYIPTEEMIITNYWVEFDFPNIVVIPEETYYIVWNPVNAPNQANSFYWYVKGKNYYERGCAWHFDGEIWEILELEFLRYGDPDFCFITYGFSNKPPDKPSQPSGPIKGVIGEELYYESFFSDPNGDDMSIMFDWGDGTNSGWIKKGGNGTYGMKHIWTSNGTYQVKTKAMDSYVEGDYSDPLIIIIGNIAPYTPSRPTGPNSGKIFTKHIFSAVTTDINNDDIYYQFDWGDGEISGWLGPYVSGDDCSESHIWKTEGTYNIKVKARDEKGEESDWSDSYSVTMPKNKLFIVSLLEYLMECFPILFQLV